MSEQQKYWFAARTRDKQEFAIRDSLEKLKTELDLNYYLPTQFVIRQLKYRRKRVEVPVIKNLIFIQATKQDACDISNKYNIQLLMSICNIIAILFFCQFGNMSTNRSNMSF